MHSSSIAMPDPNSPQAAPPDDGHLGSHTVPSDVMSVQEADQPERAPHLHQDIPPQRSGAGLGVVLLMLTVVLFTLVLIYLAYRWLP
jgi:hypothetical protein